METKADLSQVRRDHPWACVVQLPALVVLKKLEARLDAHGSVLEWADIKKDLRALQEVEVESEDRT
jgi:hypothetical protein